jgi:hypothetical protein
MHYVQLKQNEIYFAQELLLPITTLSKCIDSCGDKTCGRTDTASPFFIHCMQFAKERIKKERKPS